MTPEDYLRKKLLDQKQQGVFGAMKDSLNAPTPNAPVPPEPNPEALSGLDEVPRIHVGVQTGNLNGINRSIADLRASQDIFNQGGIPRQTPWGVEEQAPQVHKGFKDRLASVGKGILLGMAKQNAQNPESTGAQLLGAGAAGGVGGGFSPVTIDRQIAEQALRRQEEQAQTQINLAHQGALAQSEGMRPLLEQAQIQQRIDAARMRSADQAAQRAIGIERNRIEAEKAARGPAPGAPHTFTNADGSVSQWNPGTQQWEKQPSLQGQPKSSSVDYSSDISGLQDQIDKDQAELQSHQREMSRKEGAIKTQAEAKYQAAVAAWKKEDDAYRHDPVNTAKPGAQPKRGDFYDAERNNDQDYASGNVQNVKDRITQLQTNIKENTAQRDKLKSQQRTIESKPRAQRAGLTREGFIQAFKNDSRNPTHRDPTDEEIKRAGF